MILKVICSDINHPIFPRLEQWKKSQKHHEIEIVNSKNQIKTGGDILFLISCHEIIDHDFRKLFHKTLVIHASDLPEGRGWSPLIWQVLEQKSDIVISLIEASDTVDTGDIWQKSCITIGADETFNEINNKLFDTEISLMNYAIDNISTILPVKQDSNSATYYRKRMPDDSQLDIHKTIIEQFDLLRICDPERYPAFFYHLGHKYNVTIEKVDNKEYE